MTDILESAMFDGRTMMGCVHRYFNWYLFDDGGKPLVIKRWKSQAQATRGEIKEERGGIDSDHMTPTAKQIMAKAWAERNALSLELTPPGREGG